MALANNETELEAAERRIRNLPRCGAAKLAGMEKSFRDLLEAVGEDPQRQGLLKTPNRAARAFEFLTNGYRQSLADIINGALFDSDASEIILVKDIELYSMATVASEGTCYWLTLCRRNARTPFPCRPTCHEHHRPRRSDFCRTLHA